MKKICVLGVPLGLVIASGVALADVTVTFQLAEPTDSFGQELTVGALGFLAASTQDDVFGEGADLMNSGLSVGNFYGDDVILGVFEVEELGGAGSGIFGFNGLVTYGPSDYANLDEDDRFQFYWFPDVTTIGTTLLGGESYGSYRSDSITSGSTIAFFAPADGTTNNLFVNSESVGGDVQNALLQANQVVPEPTSASLLVMAAAGALAARRRPRSRDCLAALRLG
ncbi:MAG: PEP-CTERM sorting domain-containing protein [Verrucomicrobiae bacterium]|nr:PEP-CTERM sorting domain-containing protein [Verrucomicrobiae bacterium]